MLLRKLKLNYVGVLERGWKINLEIIMYKDGYKKAVPSFNQNI